MFGASEAEKLVPVLVTSTLMTDIKKEVLECVPCIYYLVQFKKDMAEV